MRRRATCSSDSSTDTRSAHFSSLMLTPAVANAAVRSTRARLACSKADRAFATALAAAEDDKRTNASTDISRIVWCLQNEAKRADRE